MWASRPRGTAAATEYKGQKVRPEDRKSSGLFFVKNLKKSTGYACQRNAIFKKVIGFSNNF